MVYNNRICWVDMAKGYAMVCVILAHIGIGKIGGWFYSWHMPVFFFLSGYTFKANDHFINFLKKQLKKGIVPYLILAISILLFDTVFYNLYIDSSNILSIAFDFIIQKRCTTLWFLACLIFLRIMFLWIIKIFPNMIFRLFLVLGLLGIGYFYYLKGGEPLAWNIDVCFMAAPFFEFGYDYEKFEAIIDQRPFTNFILFGVINVLCFVPGYILTGSRLDMYKCEYGNILLTYISAFAGIICVTLISKACRIKIIQFVGENSLFYLAWHQSIFIILAVDLLEKMNLERPQIEQLTKYFVLYNIIEFVLVFVGISVIVAIIKHAYKYCMRYKI